MNMTIELGTESDIDALEALYDDLNDYLDSHINYPGWGKGSYPVREQAEAGVSDKTLYIARHSNRIVASIILNHTPDYQSGPVCWMSEASDEEAFYIHTFVVHPEYSGNGIGRRLLDFSYDTAKQKDMKAIRLDVYEHNLPALHLYEKLGYKYIDTVDLGLGCYGLHWFKLYEKMIP